MSTSPFYPGPLGTARMWLEYIGLRCLAAPLRALPTDAASSLSGRMWREIAPYTRRQARVLEHLAHAFPEISTDERERITRQSWENLGRTFAESFHIDRLVSDPDRFELPADLNRYRRLARNGCVFVSLHLGNWEIAAAPALGQEIDLAGTYQAIQNPLADRYVRGLREPIYRGGLFPKGHATARRLFARAKAGKSVGFLADLRELRGVKITFFDRPAYANPFPATLARHADVPLVAGCAVRTEGTRFALHLKEIEQARTDDREADIRETTQRVHDLFELWIRRHPDQWMWSHRKWALRAEDAPRKAGDHEI